MPPDFSSYNLRNIPFTQMQKSSNRPLTHRVPQETNSPYFFFRVMSKMMLYAFNTIPVIRELTAFLYGILHIFLLCPNKKMGNIHASRIVATRTIVAYGHSSWDWPIQPLPSKAMNQDGSPLIRKLSIAVRSHVGCPYPTAMFALFIHLCPKTFLDTLCLTARTHRRDTARWPPHHRKLHNVFASIAPRANFAF